MFVSFYDQINEVMRRYLSPVNAHAILRQVVSDCRKTPTALTRADLAVLVPKLDRAVSLFLEPTQRSALKKDVELLGGASASGPDSAAAKSRARTVRIKTEADISEARAVAKLLCNDLHARPLQAHKVAIAVSELARNIVSYTPGGQIELVPQAGSPASIGIISTDTGTGIPNLAEIMSGGYRSKTGLGLGILGTKRLADKFDIQTGERGTRIEAVIQV